MKKGLILIILLSSTVWLYAQPCEQFKVTYSKYSEKNNLNNAVQSELGSSYTVADWKDLKAIRDIDSWISCMGFPDKQSFNLLVNGKQTYSGTRQYFLVYYSSGKAPSNFLVHDKIGNYLFLGSWPGSRKVLAIKTTRYKKECNGITFTQEKYSEGNNLNNAVQSELGSSYTVADWKDLKAIRDINSWISCMNLPDKQAFNLLINGKQTYSGTRQYFLVYYSSGKAPSNFLVHDKIGKYLFLGSWPGSRKVLAKKN